jgi:hypothetical protein
MEITRDARLSPCGRYRYDLRRIWDCSLPLLGWIMLNPSTADAFDDDPTIRRCMGFARTWGFGGIRVCNLWAIRSSTPDLLAEQPSSDWVNETWIKRLRDTTDHIVAAWGSHHLAMQQYRMMRDRIRIRRLWALGETKTGCPQHPLYVRGDRWPIPFLGEKVS